MYKILMTAVDLIALGTLVVVISAFAEIASENYDPLELIAELLTVILMWVGIIGLVVAHYKVRNSAE